MNPKSYPQAKKGILQQKSLAELRDFVHDLNGRDFKWLADRFPKKKGFRPGTRIELERRIEVFLLDSKHWEESEWDLFHSVWVRWVQSRTALNAALQSFDNTADFPEGGGEVAPNSTLDIACFAHLAARSQEGGVVRDEIRRFYDFGYFVPSLEIERHIATALSAREQALWALPEQLDQLRALVSTLQGRVDLLSQQSASIDSVAEVGKMQLEQRQELHTIQVLLAERFVHLEQALETLQTSLSQQQQQYNKEFSLVRHELKIDADQLEQWVAQTAAALSQEMVELRQSIKEMPLEVATEHATTTGLHVEILPCAEMGHVREGYEQGVSGLAKNLKAVGIQVAQGRALARDVLAALGCGQFVTFSGSMAGLTAEVCARSLAGGQVWRIQIPIGLLDGHALDEQLKRLCSQVEAGDKLGVLILEGLNFSAPAVYASCIHRLITERLLGLVKTQANLLLFGTLITGTGGLDVALEVSQWGPIFDTDALTWPPTVVPRPIEGGQFTASAWRDWTTKALEEPEEWVELAEGLEKDVPTQSALWLRGIYAVCKRLHLPPESEGELPTGLASLAFGWLVPRFAAMLGEAVTASKWLEVVRQGEKPDQRLERLLTRLQVGREAER